MTGGAAKTVRLALDAMATRFELVLLGPNEARLRAVGEEALREIQSIERRFSFYNPSSELAALNRTAHAGPVRIAPDLFGLLERSFVISNRTQGAFDPTIGPLMRCWGFYRDTGHVPTPGTLAAARAVSGRVHVDLDPSTQTVRFDRKGVEIDLGGIAKGYAIDEAVRLIRENGVADALLHGGTSTVMGLGSSYDGTAWRVAISDEGIILGTLDLSGESLSVSAPSGKSFTHQGARLGHVLDPRTGAPSSGAAVAAVTSASATDSDALSTAALILAQEASMLIDPGTGLAVWSDGERQELIVCKDLPGFSTDFEHAPTQSDG